MSLTGQELAKNLVFLSKQLKQLSPYSAAVKAGFKVASKNDIIRSAIYLLDLLGRLEQDKKNLQSELDAAKELLKESGIELDGEDNSAGSEQEGKAGTEAPVQSGEANGAA